MVLPAKAFHPAGEAEFTEKRPLSSAIEVETFAGKVHVEWDPQIGGLCSSAEKNKITTLIIVMKIHDLQL